MLLTRREERKCLWACAINERGCCKINSALVTGDVTLLPNLSCLSWLRRFWEKHPWKFLSHFHQIRRLWFIRNAWDRKTEAQEIYRERILSITRKIDLDEKWSPLLDYLCTFGLKELHFIQMYERHMPSLKINACSAQERLEYLSSVGAKHRDILRQPQIP